MTKKLQDKVALITGGTTGMGLATAKLFAEEGAKVIVTGVNPKTLEAARAELGSAAEVIASDTGSSAAVEALARDVKAKHNGVDVLFLNAGIATFAPIPMLDEAAFDESIRVNLKGPWLMLKYFGPMMRRGGSVVMNTSAMSYQGTAGASAYSPTKAALRSLVRIAAAELVDAGVRVNAVAPGPVTTPIYGKLGMPQEALDGYAKGLMATIPMKRFGTSEEIAKAALFLASGDSSFMTGEEIVCDGGITSL